MRMSFRLKLKALHRFTSTATAVEDMTALQEGKLGPGLKKFLTDEVLGKGKGKDSLLVVDKHLGTSQAVAIKSPYDHTFSRSSNIHIEKAQYQSRRV